MFKQFNLETIQFSISWIFFNSPCVLYFCTICFLNKFLFSDPKDLTNTNLIVSLTTMLDSDLFISQISEAQKVNSDIKGNVVHTCIPSSKSLSDLFKASSSAEVLPAKWKIWWNSWKKIQRESKLNHLSLPSTYIHKHPHTHTYSKGDFKKYYQLNETFNLYTSSKNCLMKNLVVHINLIYYNWKLIFLILILSNKLFINYFNIQSSNNKFILLCMPLF